MKKTTNDEQICWGQECKVVIAQKTSPNKRRVFFSTVICQCNCEKQKMLIKNFSEEFVFHKNVFGARKSQKRKLFDGYVEILQKKKKALHPV